MFEDIGLALGARANGCLPVEANWLSILIIVLVAKVKLELELRSENNSANKRKTGSATEALSRTKSPFADKTLCLARTQNSTPGILVNEKSHPWQL